MTVTRRALLFLVLAIGFAAAATADELESADGRYPEWIDHSVAVGEDFFAYANGAWLKANPIPRDRAAWGVDLLLEQKTQTQIRDMLVELGKDGSAPPDAARRKIADFYASGMDQRAIDEAGILPLQGEFTRIAAISSRAELQGELAHLQLIGVAAPFALGQMQDFTDSSRVIAVANQAGLGLPNRDYYLKKDEVFANARREYLKHVARMLVLLGDAAPLATREAQTVMTLERALARASMTDVEQRNPLAIYHLMTLQKAAALTPHIDWHSLLADVQHPEIEAFNIAMPGFFTALDKALAATPLEDWKTYLRWQLIDAYAAYLSAPFVDESFRMRSILTGTQALRERWLRVLVAEDEALGFAIGELYVARHFPPAARQAAVFMVQHIRDAMRADLATLAWMSEATRAAARDKLDRMDLRVGYPDRWRDYSALKIDRGPYVLNMLRAREFEQRRQYAKIGKPVDRSEWAMTPQTVNAYYDLSMNSLNVPAGVLQAPYFDVRWPAAVNYGATGAATVGHELTHGFDDEGAKFDAHGNLHNWWAPQDLAKFQAATHCIAGQFSRYTIESGLHVQGDLVVGEAAADLGGLLLAWRALHALPAAEIGDAQLADQDFFVSFAHGWAETVRPQEAQEQVTTDEHPLAQFRVNGSLANSREFQTAFAIVAPSPMVKNPRCVIW